MKDIIIDEVKVIDGESYTIIAYSPKMTNGIYVYDKLPIPKNKLRNRKYYEPRNNRFR